MNNCSYLFLIILIFFCQDCKSQVKEPPVDPYIELPKYQSGGIADFYKDFYNKINWEIVENEDVDLEGVKIYYKLIIRHDRVDVEYVGYSREAIVKEKDYISAALHKNIIRTVNDCKGWNPVIVEGIWSAENNTILLPFEFEKEEIH